MSIGGTTAAIATGAKALSVKADRHQARQRPPIKSGHNRQTRQAGRRDAELHRREQRHHGGEVNVTAQKAQRWRGGALAAAINAAAEAEALGIPLA
jgi:hypothetical protein